MVVHRGRSTSRSAVLHTADSGAQNHSRSVRTVVVERRRVTPSPEAQYRYELDTWEKMPKTDYTYARSLSYDRHSPVRIASPNMSRNRLKGNSKRAADSLRQQLFVEESLAGSSYAKHRLDDGQEDYNYSDNESVEECISTTSVCRSWSSTSVVSAVFQPIARSFKYVHKRFCKYLLIILSALVNGLHYVLTSPYYIAKYGIRSVQRTVQRTGAKLWGENHVHFEREVEVVPESLAKRRSHGMSTRTTHDTSVTSHSILRGSYENLHEASTHDLSYTDGTERHGVSTFFGGVKSFHYAVYRSMMKCLRIVCNGFLYLLYTVVGMVLVLLHIGLIGLPSILYSVLCAVISAFYSGVTIVIHAPYSGTKTLISSIYTYLSLLFSTIGPACSSFGSSLYNGFSQGLSTLYNGIKYVLGAILICCTRVVHSTMNGIKSGVCTVCNAITQGSQSVILTLFIGLSNVCIAIIRWLLSIPVAIYNGLTYLLTSFATGGKWLSNSATSSVGSVTYTSYNGLRSVTSASYNGIRQAASSGYGCIYTAMCTLLYWLKTVLLFLPIALYNCISSACARRATSHRDTPDGHVTDQDFVTTRTTRRKSARLQTLSSDSSQFGTTEFASEPKSSGGICRWLLMFPLAIFEGLKYILTAIVRGCKAMCHSVANSLQSAIYNTYSGVKYVTSSSSNGIKQATSSGFGHVYQASCSLLYWLKTALLFLPIALYNCLSTAFSQRKTPHRDEIDSADEEVIIRTTRRKSYRFSTASTQSVPYSTTSTESVVVESETKPSRGICGWLLAILVALYHGLKNAVTSIGRGCKWVAYSIAHGVKYVAYTSYNGVKYATTASYNGIKQGASSGFGHVYYGICTIFYWLKTALLFLPIALYNCLSSALSRHVPSQTDDADSGVEHVTTRTTRRKSTRLATISTESAQLFRASTVDTTEFVSGPKSSGGICRWILIIPLAIYEGLKYALATIGSGYKWVAYSVANGVRHVVYSSYTGVSYVTSTSFHGIKSDQYSSYSGVKHVASSTSKGSSSILSTTYYCMKNCLLTIVSLIIFLPLALFNCLSNALSWLTTSRRDSTDSTDSVVEQISTRTTRKSARLSTIPSTSAAFTAEPESEGYFKRLRQKIRSVWRTDNKTDNKKRRRKRCGVFCCCCLPLLLLLPLLFCGRRYLTGQESVKDGLGMFIFGSGTVKQAPAGIIGGTTDYYAAPCEGTITALTEHEIRIIIAGMLNEDHKKQETLQTAIFTEIHTQQTKLEQEYALLAAQLKGLDNLGQHQAEGFVATQGEHSNQFIVINNRLHTIEGLINELQVDQGDMKLYMQQDKQHVEAAIAKLKSDITAHSVEKEAALLSLFSKLETSVSGKESDLRALFVAIIKAELAGYAPKTVMDAKLLAISERIDEISAKNSDLKSRIDLTNKDTGGKVTGLMADVTSISVKLNEWNSKLHLIKSGLESKIDVNNESGLANARLTSSEIAQLQRTIAALTRDIGVLKSSGCAKPEDLLSKDEELKQLRTQMVFKEELVEIRNRIENMCGNVGYAAGRGGVQGNIYNRLSEDQINAMIAKAIATYHADRTGKADFALESAGGSIVSIRCSETYPVKTAQLSIWGIPLWYTSSSPRSIIQPDVYPGQCWAMTGSQGFVVISLAALVDLTEFSLEHIPKDLAPDGNINSAPKEFSVWGIEHLKDFPGTRLGRYTYQECGDPIQYFPLQADRPQKFALVELRIHSNWGHPDYTCLYRFRVHGNLKRWVNDPHKTNIDEL